MPPPENIMAEAYSKTTSKMDNNPDLLAFNIVKARESQQNDNFKHKFTLPIAYI
jgi:hypothetical protein